MVVKAIWPGATLDETIAQVTERLERTLQEVPNLDNLRSFTRAGTTTIFVDLAGRTQGREVSDTWYEVRKKVGDMRHTLPQGIVGPFFNDEFGDTFGIIYAFTADGFSHRELRDAVEDVRSQLLRSPTSPRSTSSAPRTRSSIIDFSVERLAGLGFDPSTLIAALRAQNIVSPAGHPEHRRREHRAAGLGRLRLRARTSPRSPSPSATACCACATSPMCAAASPTRPNPCSGSTGNPPSGWPSPCATAAIPWRSGATSRQAIADIVADLPLGIEPRLVADQPLTVDLAINEFTTSLWQAIGIVLAISFVAWGCGPARSWPSPSR
jgi:multidrug efflux pump